MSSFSRLGGLQTLSVLVLPKNSRFPYFRSLLEAASLRHQWRIHVVCEPSVVRDWSPVICSAGACIEVPDFLAEQPWEQDAQGVAELDSFIAACERSARTSAGRILVTGERDLGRGFSLSTYHWFHNEIAKTVLADNLQPFTVVRRMFAFARQTIRDVRPDVLIAGEWADALHFVFFLAAREMGVSCLTNRFSKIWSGRGYWSADPLMYNESTRTLFSERRQKAAISMRAAERLRSFRAGPATLGYVKKNWQKAEQKSWAAEQVRLLRIGAARIRYMLGGGSGPRPKPAWQLALDFYRRRYLRLGQVGFFERVGEDELRAGRYFLIALHKDPEQALNHQATFWSNQLNTVALCSTVLPAGYSLLVREHRLNLGRRPSAFYREMKRLPGVRLTDALDDQYKYIANADLIFTENGSVGWEGLMLNRRVITFASNFYEVDGLATRIRDPERLAETVVDVLKHAPVADQDQHDRDLCWLMDAEWDCTMPLDEKDFSVTLSMLENKIAARRLQARSA